MDASGPAGVSRTVRGPQRAVSPTAIRDLRDRLFDADRALGAATRTLVVGRLAMRYSGLDETLARAIDERWGEFLREPPAGVVPLEVRVLDAGSAPWLPLWEPGEQYRIERTGAPGREVVASYFFAVAADEGGWRLGLTDTDAERADRRLDNAARFIVASWALGEGGFAMHAATVALGQHAVVLAGPSGSGKSTAVRLLPRGASFGDDFALVVPRGESWFAPAVPFDNSERVEGRPSEGELEVAGVWRLFQDREDAVEPVSGPRALASLLSCAAFPWALSHRSDELLRNARRFLGTGRFAHLRFSLTADLGSLLAPPGDSPD